MIGVICEMFCSFLKIYFDYLITKLNVSVKYFLSQNTIVVNNLASLSSAGHNTLLKPKISTEPASRLQRLYVHVHDHSPDFVSLLLFSGRSETFPGHTPISLSLSISIYLPIWGPTRGHFHFGSYIQTWGPTRGHFHFRLLYPNMEADNGISTPPFTSFPTWRPIEAEPKVYSIAEGRKEGGMANIFNLLRHT